MNKNKTGLSFGDTIFLFAFGIFFAGLFLIFYEQAKRAKQIEIIKANKVAYCPNIYRSRGLLRVEVSEVVGDYLYTKAGESFQVSSCRAKDQR